MVCDFITQSSVNQSSLCSIVLSDVGFICLVDVVARVTFHYSSKTNLSLDKSVVVY